MTSNTLSRQLAALALLLSAAPVWAQADKASSTTTTTSTTTPVASSAMNSADQTMLKEMAQTNLAEIQAGKLALSKSQDAKLKEFAQKMIDDHTLALQDLQAIAQKKGVTLPTEPDKAHKDIAARLDKLSGAAFDQRYLAQDGLSDHAAAHRLVQRVEAKAKDAELKAAAAKMSPIVNQHLASAKQMQSEHKAGATATGSSAAGTSDTVPAGVVKPQYP